MIFMKKLFSVCFVHFINCIVLYICFFDKGTVYTQLKTGYNDMENTITFHLESEL